MKKLLKFLHCSGIFEARSAACRISLLTAFFLLFLVACAPSFTAISVHQTNAVAPLIAPRWDEPDIAAHQAAHGANDFAFRLSAALVQEIAPEINNFIVSPYSVWMPLAALLNATDEAHQSALSDALGASGISPEDVNRAASRMLFNLTHETEDRRAPVHIANAVFVNRNSTIRPDFAQTFADYFRGEMLRVDFQNPSAVNEINRWASNNTQGLIPEIVQDFHPDTEVAIANAIFFSGRWSQQFNPARTRRDIFYSPSGERFAYFMETEWRGRPTNYFEDERVQALTLPFDGGSGMTIILPKDGDAVGLLASMTHEYFNRMHDDAVLAEGRLLLPRFTVEETTIDLTDALVSLGVPLFDSDSAPLTGGIIEEDVPLWLFDAVQIATIEVDEEGVTAAAVTMLAVGGSAMPVPPEITFEMICNRPFVFVLHSHTADGGRQVLFTGAVNAP
ncbi:MAG: hypothetical protein FWC70_00275 [Defluviitaleaceae bacterium]|nr:hypothetical protein [Defluviitaleaceae bacterium]